VKIRSVLACETRRGICSLCYGRDLRAATWSTSARRSGDRGAVDRRARHPADDAYVPHRWRRSDPHRAVALEARNEGTVKLNSVQLVKKKDHWVVMNRQGELVLVDDIGRERERYGLQYGARLMVADGTRSRRASCSPSGIRSRCRSSPRSPAT
jgi:DNA-directed RNA polymerase subunit beta'